MQNSLDALEIHDVPVCVVQESQDGVSTRISFLRFFLLAMCCVVVRMVFSEFNCELSLP